MPLGAPSGSADVMAVDQTKRILSVAMYALLGVAVACALCLLPFGRGETGREPEAGAETPNVILILTDDLAVNDLNPVRFDTCPTLSRCS